MTSYLSKKQLPFWIVTIAVVCGLTLPFLVRDGMFLDGVLYSTVSHHLGRGIGTFWYPVFCKTILVGSNTFHEQPPLGFAIQACFYRIVGDGWYSERLYTALMLCTTAIMIAGFWRRIFRLDPDMKGLSWLPVLIWIAIPVCSWSYRNNMCENTMGIFTIAAVWLLYDNMDRDNPSLIRYIIAGLFIFCASLTKGIPGLFPLAFPILYATSLRKHSISHILYASAVLLFTVIVVYMIVLISPEARGSLHIYVFDRLLGRVKGDPTVGNHFAIFSMLFGELLIPLVVCVLGFVLYRKTKSAGQKTVKLDLIILFLLIGLSGSLPLMLTRVQKAFYFVAALPYFGIATAIYLAPLFDRVVTYISDRTAWYKALISVGVIALCAMAIACTLIVGKPSRDADILHDVYAVAKHIPHGSTIGASAAVNSQFSIQAYLARYCDISYNNPGDTLLYYLSEKGGVCPDSLFQKQDWSLTVLDAFEKKK